MRRRIWCETLSYQDATATRVLDMLAARDVGVVLSVRPPDVAALGAVARAYASAGVPLALWPMLDDTDGRWASARNASRFAEFVARVLDAADAREVALDLEPPIDEVRALLAGRAGDAIDFARARIDEYTPARDVFAGLARDLDARGVRVSAAILPLVLYDRKDAHPTWQKALGTPVDGVGIGHASVMLYTSILEGWSRGFLKRADARALLFGLAKACASRFGAAAGVSLGVVGTGAFGDEPIYRSPEELADDVALARAAGVDELTLFDLGGVLARPPESAWLDALVLTPAAEGAPPETMASRAASSIAGASAASIRALAPLLRRGRRATS